MQQMKTKGTTPTFWRSVSAFKNNCQNNLLVATFETTLASSSAGPYLAGRGWPTTITWLLQTHRSQPWLLRPRHHQIRRVWWQSRISRCSMELEGDASVWAPVTATRAKYWQRERERERRELQPQSHAAWAHIALTIDGEGGRRGWEARKVRETGRRC